MNEQNWIDLGFLALLVVFIGVYTYGLFKMRHRYKSVTIRRGFRTITINGHDLPETMAAIQWHFEHDQETKED